MLVDPAQFRLQLFRGKADGAQYAHAAGLGNGDDDVATVRERNEWKFYAQQLADR